jgi:regulatory protein
MQVVVPPAIDKFDHVQPAEPICERLNLGFAECSYTNSRGLIGRYTAVCVMGNRKITALSVQKRNPNRVNVYLDGGFAFGLARIVAAWLQVGQELDENRIASLQEEDAREVAYQRALKFLSYRMRSSQEVQRNLQEHGVSEEDIAAVLERLQRGGLVNDSRFAQAWIENRSEYRPRSRRALSYELRQKGIPEEVIEEIFDRAGGEDEELAYQAACKQARKLKDLEWPEFRRKLGGFLARRGFTYEVIAPVVDRVWAEQGSGRPAGSNPG